LIQHLLSNIYFLTSTYINFNQIKDVFCGLTHVDYCVYSY